MLFVVNFMTMPILSHSVAWDCGFWAFFCFLSVFFKEKNGQWHLIL